MTDELIPPTDLKVELYPPQPQGGQHVGIVSGVMVTHVPTGTIVIVRTNRSAHKNRTIAQRAILSILTDPEFLP